MSELSTTASEVLAFGLERGVNLVRNSEAFVPFVVHDTAADRRVERFIGESYEDGIARAVAHVRAAHPAEGELLVLVYDGYLARAEGRVDAIWAELIETDGTITVRVQPYRPKALFKRFETLGDPITLPVGERAKL